MVNLQLIFNAEEKLVNKIIEDIRKNNYSWEILEYVNRYAEIEIDHDCFSYWNKEKYEEFLQTGGQFAEIRINRGYVYRYVNIYGKTELDWDWDDTEEEWGQYRDDYEEYDGEETECVPDYIPYGKL